ncbi:MAG: aromatic ring-hydroxylating dioxygenase subunit alpha, partial [Chloroflexi bacterium]|nr:aromatic ring-hydroxylating dioxygenase subunit alpha [Chloroflexota bacterium]
YLFPGPPNPAQATDPPGGPGAPSVQFNRYAPSKNLDEQDLARIDYSDNVLAPEDFALCESVQRGLRSRGYTQGRFIVDRDRTEISEHAVHHFHRLVQTALGD